ncbi:exodeoxyribonuclease V subunit beta [Thalassotalea sp. ND16A]|uniref:exodeoxyribonuclease V subunit beta n=1 Tax=Thalassotalea sp. ND16A TaxID=1535422 RepID=UPI00051E0883|nr:exodeoxyribonuclease V subunit beta [Thalassotalea sp. ND16A]KGJ99688.1 hypothetical protein ND16A_3788 [Thalassotalea sp. ND16A]
MANNNNSANTANTAKAAMPLLAETIPLRGRHLIEASAGTGKTFNITRIYLRMILERRLSVDNILVMTFTKAATEEIRGRIDEFLREALANWDGYTNDPKQPYFQQLAETLGEQGVDANTVKALLKSALINLDEAAIYTIHGFCKRVLSQQAFASGVNFNARMEVDDSELALEACQDFYRVMAKSEQTGDYAILVQQWPTPESFLGSFKALLSDDNLPSITSKQSVVSALQVLAQQSLNCLYQHEQLILTELVNSSKEQQKRLQEFELLIDFIKAVLNTNLTDHCALDKLAIIAPDFKFIAKSRLPRAAAKKDIKAALLSAFAIIEKFKQSWLDFGNALLKCGAYEVALMALEDIKTKVSVKKQQANVLNFDDLINQLASSLKREANGENMPLTQALLAQYPVALIDEFQDTDGKQFAILEQLYFHPKSAISGSENDALEQPGNKLALYLIGDPKQAIYAFRGGDIFTYLTAGKRVQQQWLMDTNWRSSEQMIRGYNHLFYGNDLNADKKDIFGFDIQYQVVKASATANKQQLIDPQQYTALQFIEFTASDEYIWAKAVKTEFRANIADWCAAEISRLLTQASIATSSTSTDDNVTNSAIKASDIAILVRDGREADDIKAALTRLAINSVYQSQRSNLFSTDIAKDFIAVLAAIINHEDDRAFIVALSGPYFGYSTQMLFALQNDELQWERLRKSFNGLKAIWHKRGFMAMALRLLHDYYPGCIDNSERQLTNIIHLFELLQHASQRFKQPQELMAYLQEQCINLSSAEAELRLESDADLVQIVTQHGSKGLEYPIVFAPFVSRHKNPVKFGNLDKEVLRFHDQQDLLSVHLGKDEDGRMRMAEEGYAEDVRLLYVAVTRAKYRCYLGCTQFKDYHLSPLGQTLKLAKGDSFSSQLTVLIDASPETIGHLLLAGDDFIGQPMPVRQEQKKFAAASFQGRIERDWWLSSFSALTRNIRHSGRTAPDRDNEGQQQVILKKDLLRFAFAKGAKTGNLLHDLFEHTHFDKPDWSTVGQRYLLKFGELPVGFEHQDVYDWLDDCLHTPLNDSALTLSSLKFENTLREAEFYFPMENVKLDHLQQLLDQFRTGLELPAEQLAKINHQLPGFGQLKGMMHGFIDLIFEADGKYYLCDYKSSHLGDRFRDYLPVDLASHVVENFYDLQFMIYSLALHRYLARRIKNYDVNQHFGGVYYLYLRGMSAANDNFSGVFYQSLNQTLLENLDSVFSGNNQIVKGESNE